MEYSPDVFDLERPSKTLVLHVPISEDWTNVFSWVERTKLCLVPDGRKFGCIFL